MKRKLTTFVCMTLIAVMMAGSAVYAEPASESSTLAEEVKTARFAILDTATYGISFVNNQTQINCFASMAAAHATKYVIEGMVHKKNSNGVYEKLYEWGPDTTYGKTAYVDEYFPLAGSGKYMMTIDVTIYSGTEEERVIFTDYKTKD